MTADTDQTRDRSRATATSSVVVLTEDSARSELEELYVAYPELRTLERDCCSGCAENDLAHQHGWGHPILNAWERVEELRFLLDA